MPGTANDARWSLEVARGREPGRRYALDRGETTIGSAPWEAARLCLADQEGDSPRRMAANQAVLTLSGDRLTIRDLESPGGTFVNRQRLFTDQERALAPGDVIQVGAVQLVARREASSRPVERPPAANPPAGRASPAPRTDPLAAPYTFQGGASCRSWDDFLTLSAQRWAMVRDELASGRIGEHLRRQGRSDLLPSREPGWTPDDMLDDWLGRLPTTTPSGPEIDVHPAALSVPATAAGGVARRSFRVANVGFRLLRATAAVEPAPGFEGSIRLAAEPSGPIIDEAEYVVEIAPPEGAAGVVLGAVVVAAGGVSKRVVARVEPAKAAAVPDAPPTTATATGPGWSPAEPIAAGLSGVSPWRRLWMFPLVALALRGLIALGAILSPASSGGELRLLDAAAAPALAGMVIGWGVGMRGSFRDAFASAFAGAVVALLAATVVFATIRSVEGVLGSPVVSSLALGLGLALASLGAFPAEAKGGGG